MKEKLFLIRWGNWKFENWQILRLTEHQSHDGKAKFQKWDVVWPKHPWTGGYTNP